MPEGIVFVCKERTRTEDPLRGYFVTFRWETGARVSQRQMENERKMKDI